MGRPAAPGPAGRLRGQARRVRRAEQHQAHVQLAGLPVGVPGRGAGGRCGLRGGLGGLARALPRLLGVRVVQHLALLVAPRPAQQLDCLRAARRRGLRACLALCRLAAASAAPRARRRAPHRLTDAFAQ